MKNFLNSVPMSIFLKPKSDDINMNPTGPDERLPWHSYRWGTSSARRARRIQIADGKRNAKKHRRQQIQDFMQRRSYGQIVSVRVLDHLETERGSLLSELVYEGKLDGRSGHTPKAILEAAGFDQEAIVEIYLSLESDEPIPRKGAADAALSLFAQRTAVSA